MATLPGSESSLVAPLVLPVCSTCCYAKRPWILPGSYRITSGWLCSLSGVVTSALSTCPCWSSALARPGVVSRGVP
ncbi:hypothetical protein ES703_31129 [subsurface metagenome]